jgi:hypothetical protein
VQQSPEVAAGDLLRALGVSSTRPGREDTPRRMARLHLRAAALNLRRLLNLGLTGADGTWSLASA